VEEERGREGGRERQGGRGRDGEGGSEREREEREGGEERGEAGMKGQRGGGRTSDLPLFDFLSGRRGDKTRINKFVSCRNRCVDLFTLQNKFFL